MSHPWGTLGAATAYGYSIHYFLKVEGIPTLFCEVVGDAIAPSGYDLDASLVVDDSARVGSVPSETTNIGAGFDLEARLLDTAKSREYFTAPTLQATLRADLTDAATSITIDTGHKFPTSGRVWIELECLPHTNKSWQALQGVTRGTYGEARAWPKGAIVANAPGSWLERRCDLYAVAMDPTGRYVQQGNVLSDASCLFTGFVASKPERVNSEWSFVARTIDRRLAQPFAAAAQGRAVWAVHTDTPVEVDVETSLFVRITESPVDGSTVAWGLIQDFMLRPFVGLTSPLRPSEIRKLVADAWSTATTHAQLNGLVWYESFVNATDFTRRRWRAYAEGKASAAGQRLKIQVTVFGAWGKPFRYQRDDPNIGMSSPFNFPSVADGGSGWGMVYVPAIEMMTGTGGASLSVMLEEGEPATLPVPGYLAIESEGGAPQVIRYTAATADQVEGNKVNLLLEHEIDPASLNRVAQQDAEAASTELSARFLYSDSGKAQDIMRRLLVSRKGDGSGGTYDTLPLLASYGLGTLVDTASFTRVFDGLFQTFGLDVAIDFGQTFEKIFGGLLRLSGRAIVSRPAADGSAVKMTAISLGAPTSAVYSALIDDTVIIAGTDGQPSIRPKSRKSPRVISLETHLLVEDAARGRTTFTNKSRNEVSIGQWELEVYGLAASLLRTVGEPWAEQIFRAAWTTQPIEVDVMPTIQAYAGDIVWFQTRDAHVWSYSTGRPGYNGLARVTGHQLGLKNTRQTLHLEIDGLYSLRPMSPSLAVVAVNGTATSPTSIDVARSEYALMASLATPFHLTVYLPSQDSGRGHYRITAVTDTGAVCRLTVSDSPTAPTVTLTTSHRLTFPVDVAGATPTSNTEQARYLHTTSQAQWS